MGAKYIVHRKTWGDRVYRYALFVLLGSVFLLMGYIVYMTAQKKRAF
jgi:hypothetical protein